MRAETPELSLTRLYNAIGGLRTDAPSDRMAEARGRLLILEALHARLDELVLQAYGWPGRIDAPELLSALAALNLDRRAAEQRGDVAWLRPDYQARRYAQADPAPDVELAAGVAPASSEPDRRPFPRKLDEQCAAVLQAVRRLERGATVQDAAACFRSRRPGLHQSVERALIVLIQYGHLSMLGDGRFMGRRAA